MTTALLRPAGKYITECSSLPSKQSFFSFSTFTLEKERDDQKKYTELKQEDVIKLITQLNKLIEHKKRGKKNASNPASG